MSTRYTKRGGTGGRGRGGGSKGGVTGRGGRGSGKPYGKTKRDRDNDDENNNNNNNEDDDYYDQGGDGGDDDSSGSGSDEDGDGEQPPRTKKPKIVPTGKYHDDRPFETIPDYIEIKLKPCVHLMFKDIKFFASWNKVDRTPKVMDYMFHQIGWRDKDDMEQKAKRSQLWVCLMKWIFREVSKMRSNKIAAYHNMVKSK